MAIKISNVQSFCLHDGPGIRTTIFLSGCPLKCRWCHNPETQSMKPKLLFEKNKCINCQACVVCLYGIHNFENNHTIDRSKCSVCGKCVSVCPANALQLSVKELTDCEFLEIIAKQKAFTGGGITFSGGEPLVQGEEILRLIDMIEVHTAIETSGYSESALFEKVISRVDYVMFDIKLADEFEHIKYTGVSNKKILKNLEILRKSGKPFVIRTPLIPGITDTNENLKAIEKIVGADKWEKLEYNVLTPAKYERVGIEYKMESPQTVPVTPEFS